MYRSSINVDGCFLRSLWKKLNFHVCPSSVPRKNRVVKLFVWTINAHKRWWKRGRKTIFGYSHVDSWLRTDQSACSCPVIVRRRRCCLNPVGPPPFSFFFFGWKKAKFMSPPGGRVFECLPFMIVFIFLLTNSTLHIIMTITKQRAM